MAALGLVALSSGCGGTNGEIDALGDSPAPATPERSTSTTTADLSRDGALASGSVDIRSSGVGLFYPAARYLAGSGPESITPVRLAPPGFGDDVRLNAFGSQVQRVTATAWGNHDYSQLQAFAYDNGHVLLVEGEREDDRGWVVRRWPDLTLALDGAITDAWNVPRWHPLLPETMVHFDSNEDEVLRLQFTNVASGVTETVFTFPREFRRIRGNQSFDEISRTGEWLAGLATTDSGQVIFSFHLARLELGAVIDFDGFYTGPCAPDPEWGNVEPDWVGVSPLGRFLVIQWPTDGTGRCQGLETFDVSSGAFVGRVHAGHPHGDLTVLADGVTEVFVTSELSGPGSGERFAGGEPGGGDLDSNYPALSYRQLPGSAISEQSPVFLYLTDWVVEHISCRGPIGWCLVTSTLGPENAEYDPLEGELFVILLDGSGVLRLGHHHSSSDGYWQQPRASVSADGRYVVFDSDWRGEGPGGATSAYVIDLLAASD